MKRRGFSLPEVMMSMLLVLTILGMVASLMREYTRVARHQAGRDSTFDGVAFALAEMGHEVGSATKLITPVAPSTSTSTTSSSGVLKFERVDPAPAAVDRFSFTPGTPWNPFRADNLMTVTYERDIARGALLRKVSRTSGAVTQTMAENISAFDIVHYSEGYLSLTLGFQEELRVRAFVNEVRIWPEVKP